MADKTHVERVWNAVDCIDLAASEPVLLGAREGVTLIKNDKLSFLRVFLSQMDSVLGGSNGLIPLLKGGWTGPTRELLFEPQQRVIRQLSLSNGALGVS